MSEDIEKELFFKCVSAYEFLPKRLKEELNVSVETLFFACASWLYVILVRNETTGNGADLETELGLKMGVYFEKLGISVDDILKKLKQEEINHE